MSVPSRIATAVGAVALVAAAERVHRARARTRRADGRAAGTAAAVEHVDHAAAARRTRHRGGRASAGAVRRGRRLDVGCRPPVRAGLLDLGRRDARRSARDIVSSPYLVSSADAADAARTDDPTGALATFTEDGGPVRARPGLRARLRRRGRPHPDSSTAFSATVAGCPRLPVHRHGRRGHLRGDRPAASPSRRPRRPARACSTYSEDVQGSDALGVGITFVQHENAVVAIYSELYPSSTMTPADVAEIVARRRAAPRSALTMAMPSATGGRMDITVTKAPGSSRPALRRHRCSLLVLHSAAVEPGRSGDPAATRRTTSSYTIDDLKGLIEEGDGLSTLDFEPSEVTATAADDRSRSAGTGRSPAATPAECYPVVRDLVPARRIRERRRRRRSTPWSSASSPSRRRRLRAGHRQRPDLRQRGRGGGVPRLDRGVRERLPRRLHAVRRRGRRDLGRRADSTSAPSRARRTASRP